MAYPLTDTQLVKEIQRILNKVKTKGEVVCVVLSSEVERLLSLARYGLGTKAANEQSPFCCNVEVKEEGDELDKFIDKVRKDGWEITGMVEYGHDEVPNKYGYIEYIPNGVFTFDLTIAKGSNRFNYIGHSKEELINSAASFIELIKAGSFTKDDGISLNIRSRKMK